ncbi:MAG: dicarboxylate/amino acid:cation symporter [Candidatus Cloacimonetes bacterium]|nr:dicarboxylate/amino acid:cation symporter [Candidatus Cloacimonadota bacterium]
MQVWKKILIGMVLGVFFGYFCGANSPIEFFNGEVGASTVAFVNIIGEVFLRLLKMIVVPLIFFSLCVGVASMEDVQTIGKSGGKLLVYFMFTTAVAIIIGVGLALLVQPGQYIDSAKRDQLISQNVENANKYKSKAGVKVDVTSKTEKATFTQNLKKSLNQLKDNLLEMIPSNPIQAMAETKILQIIVFAIFFGVGIISLSDENKRVIIRFCNIVNEIMVVLVQLVMAIAPYGVFTLMASSVSKIGLSVMGALIIYALTVLGGLFLHLILVYLPVATWASGHSPIYFLTQIKEALVLAFSTSSSSATLPVTMRCVEDNLGVPNKTTSFVLPLGATVNMDGTALYQGVAVVFIAQVFGVALTPGDIVTIVVMATLASVGAAGVPGAGMITLVMVLDSVNPALVPGLALVMGLDRFLDMVRTALNVTGDSTACLFMHKIENNNQSSSEPIKA